MGTSQAQRLPLPPVETCPACLGDKVLRYDDGPTVRCEECDGTGVVPEMCVDCDPRARARAVVTCPADGLSYCAACAPDVVEVSCGCCDRPMLLAQGIVDEIDQRRLAPGFYECSACLESYDCYWDDEAHRRRCAVVRQAVAS